MSRGMTAICTSRNRSKRAKKAFHALGRGLPNRLVFGAQPQEFDDGWVSVHGMHGSQGEGGVTRSRQSSIVPMTTWTAVRMPPSPCSRHLWNVSRVISGMLGAGSS